MQARGVYDGKQIILDEPLELVPGTFVELEVVVPDEDPEITFQRRLLAAGLITEIRTRQPRTEPFERIVVEGEPVSETIIRERR